MYKVVILAKARGDIQEAAQWYNEQQVGLGYSFLKNLRELVSYNRKNPAGFQIRYKDIRTAPLRIFPFLVHYFIAYDLKKIVIVAILHTSRDPKRWGKRNN